MSHPRSSTREMCKPGRGERHRTSLWQRPLFPVTWELSSRAVCPVRWGLADMGLSCAPSSQREELENGHPLLTGPAPGEGAQPVTSALGP